MGLTIDLGRRIELVSMDLHFHDISIALYRREGVARLEVLVQSYSRRAGTRERLEFIAEAMTVLGGMELLPGESLSLRFPRGSDLPVAARRVFLEACKRPTGEEVAPRPLAIFDKKSQSQVQVASLGEGLYEVTLEAEGERASRRCAAIAAGIAKLSGAGQVEGHPARVALPNGQSIDALVGLLLVRALNVRAVVRAEEAAASRGVLSAPSAQNS